MSTGQPSSTLSESRHEHLLAAYFKEYDYLKNEQLQSIGTRSHLIYILVILYTTVFSYAVGQASHYYAFLLLPWVCFVLGWMYLNNQNKITAIRFYLRDDLSPHISRLIGMDKEAPFAKEMIFRETQSRLFRKLSATFINLFLFCIPGIVSLGMFWLLSDMGNHLMTVYMLILVDLLFIVIMAVWIIAYGDLIEKKRTG